MKIRSNKISRKKNIFLVGSVFKIIMNFVYYSSEKNIKKIKILFVDSFGVKTPRVFFSPPIC